MADVDDGLIEALKQKFVLQEWLGNVRQLRNAVERAVLLGTFDSDPDPVTPTLHMSTPAVGSAAWSPAVGAEPRPSFREVKEAAVARWERDYLSQLMREAGGNLSRAARLARIDRGHLRDLLRHHQRSNT